MGRRAHRVAIIGLGPKGVFALERLVDHAAASGGRVAVDAFEPHPVPGAGPVYDPSQPDYLRMNFAADQLDMWWPGSAPERQSFARWSGRGGADDYPPRAEVGRYLADGLRVLLAEVPPNVAVAVHRRRVDAVCPHVGGGWDLPGVGGPYDEVLVATGHERPAASAGTPIAAGATVAIRGFALTFIDAALGLTEGRGGSFARLPHPYRLHYAPGPDDVGLILPLSRTGRPMLAKPPAGLLAGLGDVGRRGRIQLERLGDGFELEPDVLPIVAATAGAIGPAGTSAAAASWLAAAAAGAPPAVEEDPAAVIERSLAVGAGLLEPDLPWALGQAWRVLYPALVGRLGGGGLDASDWPAFHRLAAELERLAFGPPPENAAKLLALVDSGRVDLSHVAGGRVVDATTVRSTAGERTVDAVLDAVVPAPGAAAAASRLLRQLLADGHARIVAGGRGLEVAADGGCVGRDGTPTPGLSAIGRPTEDSVVGNDTLSRTLHPVSDLWARRVVAGAVADGPSGAPAVLRSAVVEVGLSPRPALIWCVGGDGAWPAGPAGPTAWPGWTRHSC